MLDLLINGVPRAFSFSYVLTCSYTYQDSVSRQRLQDHLRALQHYELLKDCADLDESDRFHLNNFLSRVKFMVRTDVVESLKTNLFSSEEMVVTCPHLSLSFSYSFLFSFSFFCHVLSLPCVYVYISHTTKNNVHLLHSVAIIFFLFLSVVCLLIIMCLLLCAAHERGKCAARHLTQSPFPPVV
jgi:hypothetical protein